MGRLSYFVYCLLVAVALPTELLARIPKPMGKQRNTLEDDDRIVGGEPMDITNTPHQVSLVDDVGDGKVGLCGGSIINSEWVLTAAHCVIHSSTDSMKVYSGSNVWGQGTEHDVMEIYHHEDYNSRSQENDIACMRVDPPFETDDSTGCIMMTDSEPEDGDPLRVCGWGATSEGGSVSEDLLCVNVTTVGRDKCNEAYGNSITEHKFCAAEPGKDSCQGDSGGPITNLATPLTLMGVVSYGIGCARPTHPGVYTNVAQYGDWVDQMCGGNSC